MSEKTKLRRSTLFSAIITGFVFLYKLIMGIYSRSMVLLIAALSALMLLICKIVFVDNVTGLRTEKKKAYFIMMISSIIYIAIFIAFSVLKVCDIDISSSNPFEGWLGYLFIGFLALSFLSSLLSLIKAQGKDDLMVMGLRQIIFISALTDLVLIEQFVSSFLFEHYEIDITWLDQYFPLGIAGLMVLMTFIMFVIFLKYKTKKKA